MDENNSDSGRPKPITPQKLTIPEHDPNEKKTNWLKASDTKSTSAKIKADRRRKLLRLYIFSMFTIIAFIIVFSLLALVLWYLGPLQQDFWTPRGKVVAELEGHETPLVDLCYSADGKYLLTASSEKIVLLWDLETSDIVRQIRGHRAPIAAAAIGRKASPDSVEAQGDSIQFTPDYDPLAALLANPLGEPEAEKDPLADCVVVTASEDMYAIKWNLGVVPPIPEIRFGDVTQTTGTMTAGGIYTPSEAEDMAPSRPDNGHVAPIRSVAISDNGYYVLTGSDDTTAILWNPATGKKYSTLSRHTGAVTAVALSPSGKAFATGSQDRTVYLWDLNKDAVLHGLTGHTGTITALAYSKDGKSLVSASDDCTAVIWNCEMGSQFQRLAAEAPIRSIGISSTGKYILFPLSANIAALWDIHENKKAAQFTTDSPIVKLALSPVEDASRRPVQIAIATADMKVVLYSVPGAKAPAEAQDRQEEAAEAEKKE